MTDIKPTNSESVNQGDNRQETDLPSIKIEELLWTNEEREKSLNKLYQYAEIHAWKAINWYLNNKSSKSKWSRTLRLSAIILGTLGGLSPVLAALNADNLRVQNQVHPFFTFLGNFAHLIAQLGYFWLALAAACLAIDRFFGFSSGWMRYMTTANYLMKILQDFRVEWAMIKAKLAGKPPTDEQVQLNLQRIKDFIAAIDLQVEQETSAWVSEFQTSLADIERSIKKQEETTRPGAIDVTVTNGMEAEGGFTVSLDGMAVATIRGTKYQIGYVPPGPHKISVIGKIGNNELDASELVNVAPGVIAKVTLALPVVEAQP